MSQPDLDPRWDWIEIPKFGKREPDYIRGACRHTELIPVESVSGEVVAKLCLTCDQQFTLPRGVNQT
jgi:hypothetical protein